METNYTATIQIKNIDLLREKVEELECTLKKEKSVMMKSLLYSLMLFFKRNRDIYE
ncbi:MAG: hypothetical protein E6604_03200 [Veillonella sp.]|jgi:hypothetical protein|nr:hypothetical protein [Veillonella sp.]